MAEAWERAIAAALKTCPSSSPPRALNLDGAVKSHDGRLPPPPLLDKLAALEELSVANVRLSTLDGFPRLLRLRRLVLSDNRIAGGLSALSAAGLPSLRDLDLSNNRVQAVDELAPLAELRLESLDLYACPVTKVEGYRSKVFALIPSLKYLDKVDADGNELPETDEDEDEEDEDEDEEGEEEEEEEENGDIDDDKEEDQAREHEAEAGSIDGSKAPCINGSAKPQHSSSSVHNKRKRDTEDGSGGKE